MTWYGWYLCGILTAPVAALVMAVLVAVLLAAFFRLLDEIRPPE